MSSPKDYTVGYGRPPKDTQFKPKQSGNPAGRPKGSKNTRTLVQQALDEKVRVTVNGRTVTLTKREVAAKQQVDKAAKGDTKAFLLVTQFEENALPLTGTSDSGRPSEIAPEDYDDIVAAFLEGRLAQDPLA